MNAPTLAEEIIDIQRTLIVDAWEDKKSAENLMLELNEDDFNDPAAADGFDAIKRIVQASGGIDVQAVTVQLQARGRKESASILHTHWGGSGRSFLTSGHFKALVDQVKEATWIRKVRAALKSGQYLIDRLERGEDDVTRDTVQSEITGKLTHALGRDKRISGVYEAEALSELADHLEQDEIARANGEKVALHHLPFGFTELDRIAKGGGEGELIILGARPKMGKSAIGMSIARSWDRHSDGDILFFTKEMTRREKAKRIAAQVLYKPVEQITSSEVRSVIRDYHKLYIVDHSFRRVVDVSMFVRRHSLRRKVSGIVLDYLQLYCAEDRKEVGEGSRLLKELAMDMKCPVLCLSQLSRKCEDRPDKRPQESDLRESGAIEQDANKILLLFRPSVYRSVPMYRDVDPADADITLTKQRNGPGHDNLRIPFKYYGDTYTFVEDQERAETPEQATFPWQEVPMHDMEFNYP